MEGDQDEQTDRQSLGQRFDDFKQNNRVVVIVLAALFVVGTIGQVAGVGRSTWDWIDSTFRWRQKEYHSLSQLEAGQDIGTFTAALGPPTFKRSYEDRYIESMFKRPDHWVQTLNDDDGQVVLFAVVSCDERFRPTFAPFTGGRHLPTVQLRADALGDTELDRLDPSHSYFISGASAPSRLIDSIYGAAPGRYQTYFWGASDVCAQRLGDSYSDLSSALAAAGLNTGTYPASSGVGAPGSLVNALPPEVRKERDGVRITIYGETAPDFHLDQLPDDLVVGGNYQVTRDSP